MTAPNLTTAPAGSARSAGASASADARLPLPYDDATPENIRALNHQVRTTARTRPRACRHRSSSHSSPPPGRLPQRAVRTAASRARHAPAEPCAGGHAPAAAVGGEAETAAGSCRGAAPCTRCGPLCAPRARRLRARRGTNKRTAQRDSAALVAQDLGRRLEHTEQQKRAAKQARAPLAQGLPPSSSHSSPRASPHGLLLSRPLALSARPADARDADARALTRGRRFRLVGDGSRALTPRWDHFHALPGAQGPRAAAAGDAVGTT